MLKELDLARREAEVSSLAQAEQARVERFYVLRLLCSTSTCSQRHPEFVLNTGTQSKHMSTHIFILKPVI